MKHLMLPLILLACASVANAQSQDELEKQFAEKMTGATLVGHFTVDGREGQREERYEITRCSKILGETWLFVARVKYGQRDLTVPMKLTVKWAGDTPMVYLDELNIPGLGTYSARVIFKADRYAGTWDAQNAGGHLYGRIERTAPATQPAETNPTTQPAPAQE